ncbi:MAG: F0F1 ATP synthase subunit gamma [Patescibacteria group bacterium]|nr:F0F1 ATP synthase subunit gamma [Patescibacteria group bacterium]
MPSLLSYRSAIHEFEDVLDTVKTEEKIAAASIHTLRASVEDSIRRRTAIKEVLDRLSVFIGSTDQPLLQKKPRGKRMLVVLTGDKGLVGGLYHNLITLVEDSKGKYDEICVVGAKGEQYLREEHIEIAHVFSSFDRIPDNGDADAITGYIFERFNTGDYAAVDIAYPQFHSLGNQQPAIVPFLPFVFAPEHAGEAEGFPIFDPDKKAVYGWFLERYVSSFFYQILLEYILSEFSARTVSMENAGQKTKEFLQHAKLTYFKVRRRLSTQKQLESFTAFHHSL